jgi:cation diffusion facilitator family transporter
MGKLMSGLIKVIKSSTAIRVTVIGAGVNVLLCVFKFIIGYAGNSRALVADAVHSLSDLVSDFIVLLGIHFGSMPPDKNHHYGHKKIETATEVALGIILIIVAIKLAYDSAAAIWLRKISQPTTITIAAAIISILSKEWLFRWTKRVGVKYDSPAIIANAWHHRSDAFSSVAVLVGLVFTQISSHLLVMDAIASLVVSVLILKVGWSITHEGYKKIIDTAPPVSYVDKVLSLIRNYPGVTNPHKLKMRYIGNGIHMEVHIEVDPDISVRDGHDLAAGIKHMIKDHDKRVIDVIVHVEPAEKTGDPD